MNSHWPIFLAVAMVGAAVWFGIKRQSELSEAASVPVTYRALPKQYNPNPPVTAPAKATPPANEANPTQPTPPAILPITTQPLRVNRSTGAQVQALPPGTGPNAPVVLTNGAVPTPNFNPALANPAAGGAVDRDGLFGTLRAALQQHFGTAPMLTNNGFAFVVDGARIDVDGTANWSIVIFNNTKAQPPVQTPNFLLIQNIVATSLDFDLKNTVPRTTGDGKTVQRPISKLGKITVETDPAMFNSMTIKPFGRTGAAAMQTMNGNVPVTNKPVLNAPAQPLLPTGVQPAAPAMPPTAQPVAPAVPKLPPAPVQPPRAPQQAVRTPVAPPATQPKAPPVTKPKTAAPTTEQF